MLSNKILRNAEICEFFRIDKQSRVSFKPDGSPECFISKEDGGYYYAVLFDPNYFYEWGELLRFDSSSCLEDFSSSKK